MINASREVGPHSRPVNLSTTNRIVSGVVHMPQVTTNHLRYKNDVENLVGKDVNGRSAVIFRQSNLHTPDVFPPGSSDVHVS